MTNNQAEAYAKMAMKLQDLDSKVIDEILATMRGLFDTYTEVEVCQKMFGCDY